MKIKLSLALAILSSALLLTGCPSSGSNSRVSSAVEIDSVADFDVSSALGVNSAVKYDSDSGIVRRVEEYNDEVTTETYTEKNADDTGDDIIGADGVILIRTVSMSLESEERGLQTIADAISYKASNLGGYAESNRVTVRGDYNEYANLTLRIPSTQVDTFLAYVEDTGLKVTSKNDSVEDVTLEYTDLASRIKMKEIQRDKYIQYMEQADTIEDLLNIDNRLQKVLEELDSAQSQMNVLSKRVTYSTIDIDITWTEPRVNQFTLDFNEEMEETFQDLLETVVVMIKFVILIVPNIIFYSVVIIIICRLLWWVVTKLFKITPRKKKSGRTLLRRVKDKVADHTVSDVSKPSVTTTHTNDTSVAEVNEAENEPKTEEGNTAESSMETK